MNRLVFLSALCLANVVAAGDWPQILGPNRNGIGVDEKLADSWPDSGPKTVWQRDVGQGFSGVVVADNVAVLFHRVGDSEVVEAMNAKTGKKLWATKHPTGFSAAFSPDKGPRCTPLIHAGRVYVFGAQGTLRCLQFRDGKVVWTRQAHKEFGAAEGYFGAGSSPVVAGDNLLVNVGSRANAGIVAFDLKTGKTAWKSTKLQGSYSSPVVVTVDGTQHAIFITRLNIASLDPANGKVRFVLPFGKRGPTVNGASPLVIDGHIFASAHYGVGGLWAKIGKAKIDVVWKSDTVMSNQYMTCIGHDKHLIGIHGQERVGESELRCFDPKTQAVKWKKAGFGYGSMISADGKFIALTTTGELIMLKADAKAYRELGRATVFRSTARALPALSNGLLYVRDTGTLKCLDLRAKGK